jgi:hypothetical protein
MANKNPIIRTINNMSPLDLSYMAGLVDGEGNISLSWVGCVGKQNLHPNIAIANSNRDVLEWVLIVVGWGGISTKPRNNPKWKDAYSWRINGHLAIQFAKALLPYLKIKRIQAETLIEFEKTIQLKEFRHKLPPEVRAERERIKAKMTILNMRGKNGNTR